MKFKYICGFTLALVFVAGCSSEHHEDAAHKEDAHDHEGIIVVHSEQAKSMGIKTGKAEKGKFRQVIKVGGEILPTQSSQVVVSAKSSGVVRFAQGLTTGVAIGKNGIVCTLSSEGVEGGDPKAEARIVYDAAKKEFERVAKLYESQLATEKEYQEARRALDVARNVLDDNARSTTVVSPIAGVVSQLLVDNGSFVSTGSPIAVVCSGNKLILKAIVPQTYYESYPLITSANFKLPYNEETLELDSMNGKRISSEVLSPVSTGYFDLEFEFDNNGTVVPGTYAEVYLLGAERDNVVTLPLSAIVEEEGTHSVFVKEEEEHYEKRSVALGESDGTRVEIKSGVKAGETVVVEGAVYVKLAANTGVIPEGHHHH